MAGIKVKLSSTNVNHEWEESQCSDLPELVNSIKKIKQSVNDYLTDLVNKEKGSVDKSQKQVENSDEEEEDPEDTISGFIKAAVGSEEMKMTNKRKVQGGAKLKQAKKKK